MFVIGKTGSAQGTPPGRLQGQGHTAALRAYWEGLRQADSLPARDRIDPRGLITALSHVFLIERQAEGLMHFRLAGQTLCDLVGSELRAAPVERLFMPESHARLVAQLDLVFTGPCALEATLTAPAGLLRPPLSARMVVLPLTGLEGRTTLAIGCVDLDPSLGLPPRRLTLERVLREPLCTKTPAAQDRTAEVPADVPPAPTPGPKLRLVHSRD
jgi:hypothetical protein